ncbi:hypothetical protein, unlikely [Trypanosoma brucei gambiense DAL972]|uniref:Uncharacterized protein n=1 Tax=Trypanosoma brucei gambiense (strain MHOM/CI/86/DAL972) TaxID=679716 RepID=C9ZPB6_TRYB9|nr:hypothetical protein, unlikely [Trypanosoma brucei gambiense DAL972]CBH11244.1 hypothetical protein, unlikely [Trypanosoma brucei gambiense DAL972]|eukprot:XP_011773531.1 hypothetical protein, unlikely [Trypanosoma brucei gambiense DAL972]
MAAGSEKWMLVRASHVLPLLLTNFKCHSSLNPLMASISVYLGRRRVAFKCNIFHFRWGFLNRLMHYISLTQLVPLFLMKHVQKKTLRDIIRQHFHLFTSCFFSFLCGVIKA